MKSTDKKPDEFAEPQLPSGGQIAVLYAIVWYLQMSLAFLCGSPVDSIILPILLSLAVVHVLAIISTEITRWRRDKQNRHDSSLPPT